MKKLVKNYEMSQFLFYLAELLGKDKNTVIQSKAYANAGRQIQDMENDICEFKNSEDLSEFPFIGKIIAKDIIEYCQTGHFKYLEKTLITATPKDILSLIKGIDSSKIDQTIEFLDITSFYVLLKNFQQGKLKLFFDKTSTQYQDLTEMFNLITKLFDKKEDKILKSSRPSTSKLLDLDKTFIRNNSFRNIKFNTKNIAFQGGIITIGYSDSQSAKDAKALGDWVKITYEKNNHSLMWIVITSKYGKSKNKRIVMGEEKESLQYYLDTVKQRVS